MVNQVTISGNLTADPQLRFTQSGKAVASFTIAHNERRLMNGQWETTSTVFVDVSVWNGRAEAVAESLSKGQPVIVSGRLKIDEWETKEGQKRSKLSVTADSVGAELIKRQASHDQQWGGYQDAQQAQWGQQTQQWGAQPQQWGGQPEQPPF